MGNIRLKYKIKLKRSDIILIFITFFCFISMVTFSLISFYNFRKNQIIIRQKDLQQYANEYKNSIDDYFRYNFNILEYLASYSEIYNMDLDEQYTFLKNQRERLNFEHFIVMDLDGKGYYINSNEIKDQSQEQFFYDVINNDRFITEPFIQEFEHRAITTLSVSIYNNGKKVGALCGVIDLNKIYNNFKDKIVGNNGYSFLISNNGIYIAHKNYEYVFNSNNFFNTLDEKKNDIDLLKEKVKSDHIELTEIILDNKVYYANFTPLNLVDWTLVFVIPQSEFLVGLNKFTLFQFLAIISGILLIVAASKVFLNTIENHKLAYTDALTNLNNRTAIDSVFKTLDNDYKSRIIIVCFDLNDFKHINDTYGHNIGDKLLITFSNILSNTFANIGFLGRMGGDEFIAILKNRDVFEVKDKLKKLNDFIAEYNNNSIYKIKISYGYAVREVENKSSLVTIYNEADKNMYDFKNKCKNLTVC